MRKTATWTLTALALAAALLLPAGAEEGIAYIEPLVEPTAPVEEPIAVEPGAPVEEPGAAWEPAAEEPADGGGGYGDSTSSNGGSTPGCAGTGTVDQPADGDGAYISHPARDSAGRFTSAQVLLEHWEETGWPDGVGLAWSADGTMECLVVAVVDGDQAVMDAIRAQMADPDCLTFTSCAYSHRELETALEEIGEEMRAGTSAAVVAAIGVRDNDFTADGEPCVHVTVSARRAGAAEYAAALEERYGGLVEVELTDAEPTPTIAEERPESFLDKFSDITAGPTPGTESWPLWLALVLLGALGLVLVLRHRAAAALAGGGTAAAPGRRVSRVRAERAVRESAVPPGENSWEAIRKELD